MARHGINTPLRTTRGDSCCEVMIRLIFSLFEAKVPLWLVLILTWFVLLLLQQQSLDQSLGAMMQPLPKLGKEDRELFVGYA
jgi:hypothetical protein